MCDSLGVQRVKGSVAPSSSFSLIAQRSSRAAHTENGPTCLVLVWISECVAQATAIVTSMCEYVCY